MSILLIPMACVWMFGRITGRMRHAVIVFAVMAVLLVGKVGLAVHFESAPTAAFAGLPVQPTGNLEGKELRFGSAAGPLWGTLTTATSNGSVNSMHDSFNPLTGLIPLAGMWLNVTFGGVGVGPDQHVPVHHRRGIYLRHDGRPHPGILEPEGRDPRDETRPLGAPGSSACSSWAERPSSR